jgi:hypothetical protein
MEGALMFKAYSFAEKQMLAQPNTAPEIALQIKQASVNFLAEADAGVVARNCPACGNEESTHFAEIMEVEYRCCSDCQSIFALVKKDTASRYAAYPALQNLKQSVAFQASACESRTGIWHDLLFWTRFRCARYLADTEGFDVADISNPYDGLSDMFENSGLCKRYERAANVSASSNNNDLVIWLDQLYKESDPRTALNSIYLLLKDGGLLFLSARLGSGFDVLALKGNNPSIFPCEHLFLPSSGGLVTLLEATGFEVLEFFTPGNLDIEYVLQNRNSVEAKDQLIAQILESQDTATLLEFQRFLQKSGLSSHARLVVRKTGSKTERTCEN